MPLWLILTLAEVAIALAVAVLLFIGRRQETMLIEEVAPPKWCHLELFGHDEKWGLVEETFYAGRRWLEVVTPEIHIPAFTPGGKDVTIRATAKLYHPNAVYAITEYDERTVMRALGGRRAEWGPGIGEAHVRIHADTTGMQQLGDYIGTVTPGERPGQWVVTPTPEGAERLAALAQADDDIPF